MYIIYKYSWNIVEILSCVDGSIYEGELLNNKYNGKGKLIFPN